MLHWHLSYVKNTSDTFCRKIYFFYRNKKVLLKSDVAPEGGHKKAKNAGFELLFAGVRTPVSSFIVNNSSIGKCTASKIGEQTGITSLNFENLLKIS